jgi:hypothetical protein
MLFASDKNSEFCKKLGIYESQNASEEKREKTVSEENKEYILYTTEMGCCGEMCGSSCCC